MADPEQRLVEVRNTAEIFYKFHVKKGELRDLKTQLDEIRAQRTQLDMQASAYAELINDRLQKEYKEAIEGEGRTSARIAEINRLLLALPEVAELKHLQTQLSLLQSLPKAPASWTTDLEPLKKEEAVQAAEEFRIERDLARVQTEIDGLTVDEIAVRVHTEMGRFKELRSRSVGSAVDLPSKREERIACKGTIDGILVRMGRANEGNPENLILTVSKSGSLQRLIESWSGVASKQQTVTEERKRAEVALSRATVSGSNLAGSCEGEIESLSDLLREVSTVAYLCPLPATCSMPPVRFQNLSPSDRSHKMGFIERTRPAMENESNEPVPVRKSWRLREWNGKYSYTFLSQTEDFGSQISSRGKLRWLQLFFQRQP